MNTKRVKIENNRVVYYNSDNSEFLQGSSLYKNINGQLIESKQYNAEKKDIKDTYKRNYCNNDEIEQTETEIIKKRAKSSEYKLNKQKVRGKVTAFFALKQSQKFSAFYSISFPRSTTQQEAVKAFNTWRTRLSKLGLKTFIRICEFQQNGTIHFHMLTNNFLNIKTVNHMMAKILENMGIFKRENKSEIKYNGVDVKHVRNTKDLGAYLTKYVSKNKEVFEVLPYHSSRNVSALFYSISIPLFTANIDYKVKYKDVLRALRQTTTFVIENDFALLEYFGKDKNGQLMHAPNYLMNCMYEENQYLFDLLQNENLIIISIQANTLKN